MDWETKTGSAINIDGRERGGKDRHAHQEDYVRNYTRYLGHIRRIPNGGIGLVKYDANWALRQELVASDGADQHSGNCVRWNRSPRLGRGICIPQIRAPGCWGSSNRDTDPPLPIGLGKEIYRRLTERMAIPAIGGDLRKWRMVIYLIMLIQRI